MRGCVGLWKRWHSETAALSSHFSLGMGSSLEREAGTGELFQSCRIDGCGCFMWMRNRPMEGAGGVCSSSFHLLSWCLQTCIDPSLLGRWVSLLSHRAESLLGSVRDTQRDTCARLLRNQPQHSAGAFAQGLLKVLWPICLLIFVISLELPSTPNFVGCSCELQKAHL